MDEDANNLNQAKTVPQGGVSHDRTIPDKKGLQQLPANGKTMERRTGSPPSTSSGKQWTPELRMQLIKEIVTAVFAFLIIVFTIIIVWRSFTFVGNAQKTADAKNLLTIMLGLAGTVVGYYFGRVSADAQASQATAKAGEAMRQNANLKTKAQGISANLDRIIDDSPQAMVSDSQAAANHLTQLRSLRDELHDLTAPSVN